MMVSILKTKMVYKNKRKCVDKICILFKIQETFWNEMICLYLACVNPVRTIYKIVLAQLHDANYFLKLEFLLLIFVLCAYSFGSCYIGTIFILK